MTSGFSLVRLTGGVKVFISSLIGGQEEYRNAAEEAIAVLGHQAIRAEQFPASAATPQQACLAGVREADVVILSSARSTARHRDQVSLRPTRSTGRRGSGSPCWCSSRLGSRRNPLSEH